MSRLVWAFLLLLPGVAEATLEELPVVAGASATIGAEVLPVYQDPRNPEVLVVLPTTVGTRYLIDRKRELVLYAMADFVKRKDKRFVDSSWRDDKGYLSGVGWGDPDKTDITFWSLLFRRPRFSPNAVEFFADNHWVSVRGLPNGT